jgi:starch phosphorylase
VLADYEGYISCQEAVSIAYRNREEWTKKAIMNVARSGKFSSDRAVEEYAQCIWDVAPLRPGEATQ